MLVKTRNGPNIYNPITEQLDRRYDIQQQHLNLPDAVAESVIKDSKR